MRIAFNSFLNCLTREGGKFLYTVTTVRACVLLECAMIVGVVVEQLFNTSVNAVCAESVLPWLYP